RFVEGEVDRVLRRFEGRLTRVEIHLSDIDNRKTGKADKRCLIEVRPMGAQPMTASAQATKMPSAIGEALGKMQRALATFFGRQGRPASTSETRVSPAVKTVAKKRAVVRKSEVMKTAEKELNSREPKKKGIYQARRKSWPASVGSAGGR
ncbi:MAG: HPF/RaiA family ribosome-associated protein, partial [Bryobacteraceae bacterium]